MSTSPVGWLQDERGQAELTALLLVLLLVVVAAGLVDLARLWEHRLWAQRAAEAAALAGTATGRDYESYVTSGALSLDSTPAVAASAATLLTLLEERDLETTAGYDIRAHGGPGSGSYPGYPPAGGPAGGSWTPTAPGVGVYLEVPVMPRLYGWVNGNAPVILHVFAAAEAATTP